jgi:hypothetical protein
MALNFIAPVFPLASQIQRIVQTFPSAQVQTSGWPLFF